MRKTINGEIDLAMREQREGKEYVERATDLQKRFKGPAMFARMVARRIDQANASIATLDKAIAIRRKALEMLKDASFDVESEAKPDYFYEGSIIEAMRQHVKRAERDMFYGSSIFKTDLGA